MGVGKRPTAVMTGAVSARPERRARAPPRPQCYEYLRSQGLETIAPEDASKLAEGGEWVVVDVRRGDQYAKAHPQGAVSIPLYRKLEVFQGGFDPTKVRPGPWSGGVPASRRGGSAQGLQPCARACVRTRRRRRQHPLPTRAPLPAGLPPGAQGPDVRLQRRGPHRGQP